MRAAVLPYGARLAQVWLDDTPLCLGFNDRQGYVDDVMSIGAVCGRYGNRIEDGVLQRDGQRWQLAQNEGQQCLHGGPEGFAERDWEVHQASSNDGVLRIVSDDGDQGWPGQCDAYVRYALENGLLIWEAWAEVDQSCPLNLIQHAYWNLGAPATGHQLRLNSAEVWESDERLLPQRRVGVSGDLDFQTRKTIPHHHFDRAYQVAGHGLREMAELSGPHATLQFFSDQPSIQLYTAGSLLPTAAPNGQPHSPGNAVCLETQQLPNGPALGEPVWIEPGQTYRHHLRILIKDPSS